MLTIRSTPTWKSSEFVDVGAATFCTTLTSGDEPVDAQRPTVPAVNWGEHWVSARRSREVGETYVDVVCEVEPGAGGEGCVPVRHLGDHPLQVSRVRRNAVLQLWQSSGLRTQGSVQTNGQTSVK